MHGGCGDFAQRGKLLFAPILAAEHDESIAQGSKQALIDELNLIDGCSTGQCGFTVSSEHHVVGEIDGKRHDILQDEQRIHGKKCLIKSGIGRLFRMESEAVEPGIGQILTGNGLFLLHGSDLFRKYIFCGREICLHSRAVRSFLWIDFSTSRKSIHRKL